MVENSHKLSEKSDQWFLEMNRQDDFLLDPFKPGDTIVVCGKCHRVWKIDTWELKNQCPHGECRSNKTAPFTKDILRPRLGSTARIKLVKNKEAGFSGTDRMWSLFIEVFVRRARSYYNHIEAPIGKLLPYSWKLLLGVSIGLSLVQFRVEPSKINGRSGLYYQEAVKDVTVKSKESFIDLLMTSKDSGLDVFESSKDLGGNMITSVADTAKLVKDSVVDTWDTTKTSSMESFRSIRELPAAAYHKTIERIKEEYGIGES